MRQYLIYVLLNIVNSIGHDKSAKSIAKKMLMNISFIENSTLEECAEAYNVSVSTLNRFCRKIGMYNYSSLRETLKQSDSKNEQLSFYSLTNHENHLLEMKDYLLNIDNLDYEPIIQCIKDANIIHYSGFDYHFLFLHFQQGLILQNKFVELWDYFQEELKVDKDDLIFILTMNGATLIGALSRLDLIQCKKICLTECEDKDIDSHFDVVIRLPKAPDPLLRKYGKERIFNQILYQYKQAREKEY